MIPNIRPHNERAAAVWGSGGSAYDRVSATIADALDHVVARLNPQPGEKCLDVATGTGWKAGSSYDWETKVSDTAAVDIRTKATSYLARCVDG